MRAMNVASKKTRRHNPVHASVRKSMGEPSLLVNASVSPTKIGATMQSVEVDFGNMPLANQSIQTQRVTTDAVTSPVPGGLL